MMPKVEEEILETIVSNSVRGVFDPLAQQLTELTLKIEELNEKDSSGQKSRPKDISALPKRPLGLFSGGFCQNLILQGVSLEDNNFCIA